VIFRKSATVAALAEAVDGLSGARVPLPSRQGLIEFWILGSEPVNFLCEFPVLLCLLEQFCLESVQLCLPLPQRRNSVRRKEQDA